jgi:hypothetical protein
MGIGSELKKFGRKAEREIKRVVKQVEDAKDILPRDVRYALADAYFPGSGTAIKTAQNLGGMKDSLVSSAKEAVKTNLIPAAVQNLAQEPSKNIFDYILGAPPAKIQEQETSGVPKPRGVQKNLNRVSGQSAIVDQGVPWIIEQLEHPLFKEGRKALSDIMLGRKISYVPGSTPDEQQSNILAGAATRYLPSWLGGSVSDIIRDAAQKEKSKGQVKKTGSGKGKRARDKRVPIDAPIKSKPIVINNKISNNVSTKGKKRGIIK